MLNNSQQNAVVDKFLAKANFFMTANSIPYGYGENGIPCDNFFAVSSSQDCSIALQNIRIFCLSLFWEISECKQIDINYRFIEG